MSKTFEALEKTQQERTDVVPKYVHFPSVQQQLNFRVDWRYKNQYDIIKANILSNNKNKNLKTFMVTSAGYGEGVTTTAANLAESFAEDPWRETLLMDLNIRHPSLGSLYKQHKNNGLDYILSHDGEKLPEAQRIQDKNLFLLTNNGNLQNPLAFFNSKRFDVLLNILKKHYDYIVMDFPPVLETPETRMIASKVDGVIIVVEADKTKLHKVNAIKKIFEESNANIIGVILNKRIHYIPEKVYKTI